MRRNGQTGILCEKWIELDMLNTLHRGGFSIPRISTFFIAFICLILGIYVTPERMIALGPMRLSLISAVDTVRQTALTEIMLFKIASLVLAVVLIIIALSWEKIRIFSFVKNIHDHQPMLHAQNKNTLGVFNKPLFVMIGCMILGVLYMAFSTRIFTPEQLIRIQQEDGVIEYMSVLFLVACCLFSAILALKYSGNIARNVIHVLMAILFFLMAGEEISWGQRIFKIETPELLGAANVQGEINLHNMFGYIFDHIFIAAIFIYGSVLPVVSHFSKFSRNLFDYFGIPIASPGLAIAFLLITLHQRWIVILINKNPLGFRIEELRELLVAIALFMLMYESWRLYRNNRTDITATGSV